MNAHPLETIRKIDPEFMKHIENTSEDLIYNDGALPSKIKLLIAMAFDASFGAAEGVTSLARSAMKAGATKEEIAETIRVAYQLSGVGALYTASRGLKDLF